MREVIDLPYRRADFPYAGILEDLTGEIRAGNMLPVEAYLRFLGMRDAAELRPHFVYASTAITTGGHARRSDLANMGAVKESALPLRIEKLRVLS